MSTDIAAIVLFSGPGGVSEGLRNAGVTNKVGVEIEETAVATARAAGHRTIKGDVTQLDPKQVAQSWLLHEYRRLLLQASPPCQGLSNAGKGKGREDLVHLLDALREVRLAYDIEGARAIVAYHALNLWDVCSDERSPLTFEVVRWIADLTPEYVMLEQVPAALPIWEAVAEVLRAWGYSVWTGLVHAEQYGVPQTRKRAILKASRVSEVSAPVPTHSKYHNRTPAKLDEGVLPWVSMADALGWGATDLVGFPRLHDGRGESVTLNGKEYRGRDLRSADNPSFVVTEKARSWSRFTHMGDVYNSNGCIRQVNEPAPTMTASMDNGNFKWIDVDAVAEKVAERIHNQSGTKFDLSWPAKRPAPVIAGRDIVTMPGANANRFNGSTKSRNDDVRVTVEEAGVLQSFPGNYPWQGNKTARFQQVGNAVPPLLQEVLTKQLLATCVSDSVTVNEGEDAA